MDREYTQKSFVLWILVCCAASAISQTPGVAGESTPPVAECKPVASTSAPVQAANPALPAAATAADGLQIIVKIKHRMEVEYGQLEASR